MDAVPGDRYPTSLTLNLSLAPVAQLDRVLASEAKGHRFESCRARYQIKTLRESGQWAGYLVTNL